MLLKAPTIDTAITKSTPALQQICEEEEEEEEEECRPSVMERKSSSLNQEQMRDFLRAGARRPPCRGEVLGWGAEPGGRAGYRAASGARGPPEPRGNRRGGAGTPEGRKGSGRPGERGGVPAASPEPKEKCPGVPRGAGGSEGEAENVIKLDPGKGKSGSLRERLMQFPLCEKALAFKIHPGPKESLLSLGQFNCCHVI